jgi:hypothetical protein
MQTDATGLRTVWKEKTPLPMNLLSDLLKDQF